jgi:hypothetical protein
MKVTSSEQHEDIFLTIYILLSGCLHQGNITDESPKHHGVKRRFIKLETILARAPTAPGRYAFMIPCCDFITGSNATVMMNEAVGKQEQIASVHLNGLFDIAAEKCPPSVAPAGYNATKSILSFFDIVVNLRLIGVVASVVDDNQPMLHRDAPNQTHMGNSGTL